MKAVNDNKTLIEIYPVGSIIKFDEGVDPNEKKGGKWEIVEKNHPTYTIVTSTVNQGNGTRQTDLINWAQIIRLFQEEYDITPTTQDLNDNNGNQNTVFIDVANGHEEASYVRPYNASWSYRNGERVVVVAFDTNVNVGTRVRINFKMTYVDKSVTYYKWKRVE